MDFTAAQWLIAITAALIVGAAKTGVPGGVPLAVALFAQILPARASTGALLPLLICADLIAVWLLHKSADWRALWRIFPWTGAGILLGVLILAAINDSGLRLLIGGLIVVMVGYRLWQYYFQTPSSQPNTSRVFAASMGIAAGITSMIANAASAFSSLYLLAMRLEKVSFVATTAWFYLIVNLAKLPFTAGLGLVSRESLMLDLWLLPLVVLGAVLGRWLLHKINQRVFEQVVLIVTLLGGLRLLF